jgi:hypothetical protein
MNIYYISLGSFCYPKMIIRETNREIIESLPFDFNSSPHLDKITNILKILKENNTYDINLKEVMYKYNKNELAIKEENMYLVHFFKDTDLIMSIEDKDFPVGIELLNKEKVDCVKHKFKKRFKRLSNIINDKNNIICFLRIENYDNYGWEYELIEFTKILSQFKNPNKYLIYSQNLIHENLHFNNTKTLNYDFDIPILFIKHFFNDNEMITNKNLFITILESFEFLMNNDNVINIFEDNEIQKFYLDFDKKLIFRMANIKYFSTFYFEDKILFIDSKMIDYGYEKFILNKDGLYHKIHPSKL